MSKSFFISCSPALVGVLGDELQTIGLQQTRISKAGIYFEGSLEDAYRVCLWSRIANRVFLELHQHEVKNEQNLYDQIQAINWSEHFEVDCSIAIHCNIVRSKINNSHYAALKAKDAIVDQFRANCGERPSVDTENPDIRIMLYLFKNQLTVSLDLSGESLHRRAYRTEAGLAPLKENLAAALLYDANWPTIAKAGGACLDPMCGSATFLIEAAMMAADIAPALNRKVYGFSKWKKHKADIFEPLLQEATQRRKAGLKTLPEIIGFDANQKIIKIALDNIKRVELQDYIKVKHLGLTDFQVKNIQTGLMICNPPYGKRLSSASRMPELYSNIGKLIKTHLVNWHVGILLADRNLDYELGMTTVKSFPVKNGALDCFFQYYGIPFLTTNKTPAIQQSQGMSAFANRLRKNHKKIAKWANKNQVNCYRVYDVDIPEYAFGIDLFYSEKLFCHVQEYQAPKYINEDKVERHIQEALHVIKDVFELNEEHIFLKQRKRQRGNDQYNVFDALQNFYSVIEYQFKFLVNFTDYLDTGLFLDHRPVRQMIFEQAKGVQFLNLFSYTSTASVYAAKGGAISTLSIDMSKTYLNWAKENFVINGLDFKTNLFEQADCISWLDKAVNDKAYVSHFDLIFIDPPTFSNSKRMDDVFDIQRDHIKILTKALALLNKNGLIIFSTNYRGFKLDQDKLINVDIKDITIKTIPFDFQRNKKIHVCWEIRKK
ncbi:MAG: bifunctional 23S rRNA (guanine(2069)-N(7))-methyltransferase RlmK/23S rRNA (guanine(2445)-N(2))-methyltransferase RlmL [Thiohalomonadales bacterium]